MAERDLTDRLLAARVEPRPEYREQMRARIVKYRGGQKMTLPVAERFAAGLGVPVDELLDYTVTEVRPSGVPQEALDLLAAQVAALSEKLESLERTLLDEMRRSRPETRHTGSEQP